MDLRELERVLIGEVWTSPTLQQTITYLCDVCNGRFAGSDDERRAGDFALARFRAWGLDGVAAEQFVMNGWQRGSARLTLVDGGEERELPCMALAGSPPGKVEAQLVDAGAGAPTDFDRLGDAVAGKAVLTDARGPHRLEKYSLARRAGAAAFIFAGARPGTLIPAGSLGMGAIPPTLPGVGISAETAARLRRATDARVRLSVECRQEQVTARNIIAAIPGTDPDAGQIVVCAHYDGHDIAQGAQDNATGTAVVMEAARVLAPLREHLRASLLFILFSGEELGMFGSAAYVNAHREELERVHVVVNADVVGLAAPLRLMTQDSPALAACLRRFPLAAMDAQLEDSHLIPYSDHFNFTLLGIPSLMAVTSPPGEGRGWAHTAADTLDKISFRALREAATTLTRLLLHMATAKELPRERRSAREVKQSLIAAGLEDKLRLQGRWPF